MFKRLGSALLAATLVLTSVSPVMADGAHPHHRNSNGDVIAGVLFGAAALAIIANALSDDDHGKTSVHVHRNVAPAVPRNALPRRHVVHPVVPASCGRVIYSNRGANTYYGAPCLRRAGIDVARLPRPCALTVSLSHRTVTGYPQHCLVRNGVRIVN